MPLKERSEFQLSQSDALHNADAFDGAFKELDSDDYGLESQSYDIQNLWKVRASQFSERAISATSQTQGMQKNNDKTYEQYSSCSVSKLTQTQRAIAANGGSQMAPARSEHMASINHQMMLRDNEMKSKMDQLYQMQLEDT